MVCIVHQSGRIIPVPTAVEHQAGATEGGSLSGNAALNAESPFSRVENGAVDAEDSSKDSGGLGLPWVDGSGSMSGASSYAAVHLPSSQSAPTGGAEANRPAGRSLFEEHSGLLSNDGAPQGLQLVTIPPHRLSSQMQLCLRHAYGNGASAEDIVRQAPPPYKSLAEVSGGLGAATQQAWRDEVERAWSAKLLAMPQWQRKGKPGAAAAAQAAPSAGGGAAVRAPASRASTGQRMSMPAAAPMMVGGPVPVHAAPGAPVTPMGWPPGPPGGVFVAPMVPHMQMGPAVPVFAPMVPVVHVVPMAAPPMPYDLYGAAGYGANGYGWY